MLARHAVLLTLPSDGNRPSWSYHHTGTLPRLISFVSHSYANTGGVGVFFPFWYKTIGGGDANSLHYSSSFFSHSCALFCAFLHFPRIQPFSFQSFPHSSPKNTPRGVPLFHYYPASHFSGVGWPVLSGLYIIYFLTSLPRSLLTSLHLCFITSSSPVQSLRFQPGEK